MQLAPQPVNQRSVQLGPLVLKSEPLKSPTPATDRDRTVSRRSEPSSRATLIGEQPNPWDLLQPQDVTSRHRGAKPLRRYELLGAISLLSPEYLLSFERWPFHSETTGSLCPAFAPVRPVGLAVKHPCAIALYIRLPSVLRVPWEASVTLLEATTPVKLPTKRCPLYGLGPEHKKGSISTLTPPRLATQLRSLLPILHILYPNPALSCSKGSRGLSVPLRVPGIFTGTTISPSSRLRQCPDRYTIRAGRNLPDKEFRYLRTVIVTAAVYRGFDSMLRLAVDIPS